VPKLGMLAGVDVSAEALGISLKINAALNTVAMRAIVSSTRIVGVDMRPREKEAIDRRVREPCRVALGMT